MRIIERCFMRFMYGKPDYSLKNGDVVASKYWSEPVIVVDINWALMAAAVELSQGSIAVWHVGSLKKVPL